jgi:hypothetical protein
MRNSPHTRGNAREYRDTRTVAELDQKDGKEEVCVGRGGDMIALTHVDSRALKHRNRGEKREGLLGDVLSWDGGGQQPAGRFCILPTFAQGAARISRGLRTMIL